MCVCVCELLLDVWTDCDETLHECSKWLQDMTQKISVQIGFGQAFLIILVKGHLAKHRIEAIVWPQLKI